MEDTIRHSIAQMTSIRRSGKKLRTLGINWEGEDKNVTDNRRVMEKEKNGTQRGLKNQKLII